MPNEQSPQLKTILRANTPLHAVKTHDGCLKQGQSQYGAWYMFEFLVDGKPYVHFGTPSFYDMAVPFKEGEEVVIVKTETEIEDDSGKRRTVYPIVCASPKDVSVKDGVVTIKERPRPQEEYKEFKEKREEKENNTQERITRALCAKMAASNCACDTVPEDILEKAKEFYEVFRSWLELGVDVNEKPF